MAMQSKQIAQRLLNLLEECVERGPAHRLSIEEVAGAVGADVGFLKKLNADHSGDAVVLYVVAKLLSEA